jgi:uncharacterized protein (DUF488 family)
MVDLTRRLHGWGYQGRDVQDLIDFAQRVSATVVVDVRLTPMSRRYGFSKRRLSDALAAAGLAYLHLPALGNPRDNRPGFAEPATPAGEAAHARFRSEVLDTPAAGDAIEQVERLAETTDLVVLCFEADQATCHRSLVIGELERRSALVTA